MGQDFVSRQQRGYFATFTQFLGLVGLVLTSQLTLLSPQDQQAQALEIEPDPVISANVGWRGGSFPVEQFLGYTSPFGYRRAPDGSSTSEFHSGLDIAAPQGSYVRNWWSGSVVEVIQDGRCGTGLVIRSGGWEHIYCHMLGHVEIAGGRRYLVDRVGGIQIWEGQVIRAGTRIGRVGMTGRTTGPHLHWGLKFNAQWVDPALVLRQMYAQQSRRNVLSQLQ